MRTITLFVLLPAAFALAQESVNLQRAIITTPGQQGQIAPPRAEIKPEDLCTLEGKIVNGATGEPVRKANLILRSAEMAPGSYPASYTTTTDASGKFAMKDIEPGKYRLQANRGGFVQIEYGSRGPGRPGTTITLAPAQRMTAVDFKLTPHAVVAGRILDSDGEPVPGVQVSTMLHRYTPRGKQLMQMGGSSTNDLGEFRIFGLAPGRYYLQAAHGMRWDAAMDRSARPGPEEGYVPTYFPGTTDPASASTIDVTAGQQLLGLELRLSKARTVRVRGRVHNMTGVTGRAGMIRVSLTNRDTMFGMGGNSTVATGPDSRFEFGGLAPGNYTVSAALFDGQTGFGGRLDLTIGDSNIENVVVPIVPGTTVSGEVKVEGAAPGAINLTELRVSLRPREQTAMMMYAPANDRVQPDGAFVLKNVTAEQFTVFVYPLPDGFYVKSVTMGEQDGTDAGLNFASGAGGLIRLVIAPGAAQLEGTVTNEKQEPSPGITVVAIPEKEKRRDQFQFVKTASTDQHGRFTLKNIDPGDYRIYAWEDAESGAWMDPEFLKRSDSKAKKLTLREGARETVELRAIRLEQ